jgi:hypothetical protein
MTILMEGVVGRPDSGAFGGEGIDRPVVLVPRSFLAVAESVEESGIIHVELERADTDNWACPRSV